MSLVIAWVIYCKLLLLIFRVSNCQLFPLLAFVTQDRYISNVSTASEIDLGEAVKLMLDVVPQFVLIHNDGVTLTHQESKQAVLQSDVVVVHRYVHCVAETWQACNA